VESLKPLSLKHSKKSERQKKVLLGLVDLYIQEGKPIGSNTLKDSEFQDISSATIRNYFIKLENDGFLAQPHASGGRIPTKKAYSLYAQEFTSSNDPISVQEHEWLENLKTQDVKEVSALLQASLNEFSNFTKTACFLSSPRFDQDSILHVKLVSIDIHRSICVLVTNFGLIQTEILYSQQKLSSFSLKRLENYFCFRLFGTPSPEDLTDFEKEIAEQFFNEVLIRYIVNYVNFPKEDSYNAGLSNLLSYFEFDNAQTLAKGLAVMEHPDALSKIFNHSIQSNKLSYWIGDDVEQFGCETKECSVISIPYYINQTPAGSIVLLAPQRIPYHRLFSLLKKYSENLSQALTKSVFTHQIAFRCPTPQPFQSTEQDSITEGKLLLLENKFKCDS
jgi:heat-inducible transcriptional repressor